METSDTNLADVASIDAIITAAYDVISGPAGKKRDWDRERSLYYPGARLIPTAKPGANVGLAPQILDVDGFIARVESYFAEQWILRKRNRPAYRIIRTYRTCLEHVRIAS